LTGNAGEVARIARTMIEKRGPVKSVAPLPTAAAPVPAPQNPEVIRETARASRSIGVIFKER
jgi:hypothetical protein